MTGVDVMFIGVGLLTTGASWLAVLSRSVLYAALWLVVTLLGLAGCYLVLGAELVALVQVLVYVGGVVVLVLFALMLTRSGVGGDVQTSVPHRVFAGVLSAGVAVLLAVALTASVGWEARTIAASDSAEIGADIFGVWVWPFELLSLVLLLALVAAVAVARGAGTTESVSEGSPT
ncbi:NADH-quinone oxidoreductase subunit J [Ornithinimicrobium sp. Arc0846-15]|nr:NADH-quinone oxidoreductase subunit J [Ornithinimicrobium laminariae]